MAQLAFLPINLDLHSELCIKFRADSYFESFGTDKPFWGDDGEGDKHYLNWLRTRSEKRYGIFHVWLNQEIVGQLELGERKSDDDFGYVNLYYLVPEWRGQGLSSQLDRFAMNFLKSLGFSKVKLAVSPTNPRAIQFYKKNGWQDLGERVEPGPGRPLKFSLMILEKTL